ncbi:MAG: hypothetical protein Fur0041_05310 [Bacteroidia bacterium]
MNKYLRITEITWMVIGIICLGATAFYFIIGNNDNGLLFLICTFVSGIMYNMRRRFNRQLRRAAEKAQQEEKAGKK